jgi:hypothetical protein
VRVHPGFLPRKATRDRVACRQASPCSLMFSMECEASSQSQHQRRPSRALASRVPYKGPLRSFIMPSIASAVGCSLWTARRRIQAFSSPSSSRRKRLASSSQYQSSAKGTPRPCSSSCNTPCSCRRRRLSRRSPDPSASASRNSDRTGSYGFLLIEAR